MLKQRVITAIVMAAVFFTCLLQGSAQVFVALVGLVLMAAAWEWAGLSGIQHAVVRGVYVVMTLLALLLVYGLGGAEISNAAGSEPIRVLLWLAAAFWSLVLVQLRFFPRFVGVWRSPVVLLLLGLAIFVFAWTGTLVLRLGIDGQWKVLYLVFAVAAADIGAYFVGSAWGQRKLAPAVSPGKSWEGVLGGVAAVYLITLAFYVMELLSSFALNALMLLALLLAFSSVLGDLCESMVKRLAGAKDSGRLLPGHGGVLDRIDGLLAAMPLFALFSLLFQG